MKFSNKYKPRICFTVAYHGSFPTTILYQSNFIVTKSGIKVYRSSRAGSLNSIGTSINTFLITELWSEWPEY